ncbi:MULTISPECIES: glutathione-independent formaldehyde dehydrogenase [Streptomyces]|uniref:Glutathione-independent formaldehyde dehydrogenase n=4 Tax=Streptomyces TaxID=1883 RepID=A0A380P9V3_STRGR|nr:MULTISPECIES: glutathione-independent formaldehyde dehydrogenase [Streptomyces]WSU39192.1 glutathione-independent formaldehyde dehydrogenase [Streptomyces gougerotii]MDQ0297342.1 glutathione-independent formaldehyde dehydrogenase [Streptomyces sp. DSM 41037]PJM81521.1 aldehyde dehydrogenase [Streptomyces sp. TSRI0384-2]QNE79856.1 alcohol dehydrogenase catalytic domain-containing protein [Streptomyces rutgersensis]RPK82779.1 Glutathione-independent formaldehyde dehydrogenase [Streptomyces sp
MKAVVYKEPFKVAVEQVEDPRIQDPTDALVRITSTAICGSDLHMYEGRTAAEAGIVFGHENMGIVEEVGQGVAGVKPGDRVSMPFNVACGFCRNCLAGRTAFCLTVNPGFAGGAYGYVSMGPYGGGQAEYLRVPFADFNCLRLPPGTEHEDDFAMLADIFPTGYHATELAQVSPGETVVVSGAGPVGLMAAYSALLRGASKVFVIDKVPSRLALAEQIGAIPVDYSKVDAVEQITEQTDGDGADKGIDAVGYQATAQEGEEQPAVVLNSLVKAVRPTGMLGVVGLYVPSDPGAPNEDAAHGRLLFNIGEFWEKGLRMATGQANVKAYNQQLRDLIIAGRASPSFVVSKRLPLEDAPDAYRRFDKREDGYSKVVLQPGLSAA